MRRRHEDYVHPPLIAREPPAAAPRVWLLRLVGLVLLAALVLGLVVIYQAVSGVGQAPEVGTSPAAAIAVR